MSDTALFSESRKVFHAALLNSVLRIDASGIASNADRNHKNSVRIASGIAKRIGSPVAVGTGDIDCVYSFALTELRETLDELDLTDAQEMLQIMVEGKRLKDIADLPLDLAV